MIKKERLLKLIAVMMLAIMSVAMLTGCGKNGKKNDGGDKAYLEPLKYYFDGIINKDLDTHLKSYPDFANKGNLITMADIEDLFKTYESQYGANIKIDYAFGDATKIEGDAYSELVGEITAAYKEVNKDDIKEIYDVPVTVNVEGDGLDQDNSENKEKAKGTEQHTFYVFKYKDSWYTI